MTNRSNFRLHRYAAMGLAAAAVLALGSLGNEASAAPGHGYHPQNQCSRQDVLQARSDYATENTRLENLTDLRVFRYDRRATLRVNRIAATARRRAEAILAQTSRVSGYDRCAVRVHQWRAASRELRVAIDDINRIRARQIRRMRNTGPAPRYVQPRWNARPARPAWNARPVRPAPRTTPVIRDHRGHDHRTHGHPPDVTCGTTTY